MTICIDTRMLYASGIGTYLQNLLPYLAESYELILIGNPQEIACYQAEKIPTSIPIYSIKEIFKLPFLIPACDIFWSPHYNVPLLPIKAKKRLVTVHDVFHLAFFNTLNLKQKIYAKTEIQAAVNKSAHIITVSSFSKEEIIKYTKAPSEKISVIYNGINHDNFRIVNDHAILQQVKDKYNLPNRFILYVGNIKPHKNLISLIKAFALIKHAIPDYHLVIVGKKEGFITNDNLLFEFIDQDTILKQRVHFTGYVDNKDLPVLYNLAQLFVFPSLYEGFGLPPLEAMACGCPVLVSNRASMPEICGEHAHYVDPTDTKNFSLKIKEVIGLKKEHKDISIKAGIDIASSYTWKKSLEKHIEVINNLCNNKKL